MFYVYKISNAEPIDFAAEELKKYLRMMRPDAGDVKISFDKEAKDGFRLGLMSDFGLDTSDVENPSIDDIIYIDTKENEGIIAGSNPRSVLFAVYEYLKKQGCGFYYPGIDGEYIPYSATRNPKDLEAVKYRYVPTTRYRGQSAKTDDIDQIDFLAKVGINTVMIEFMDPPAGSYNHANNQENFPPEPVSKEFSKQLKRRCEIEYARRGFHFHDIGHGWLTAALGFDNSLQRDDKPGRPGYNPGHNDSLYTEEQRSFLAMKNGERKLIYGVPLFTQICMSNEEGRKIVVNYIADYADTHTNIDYLHVWLSDLSNNQCECDACRKKTPSDWYMIMMNELDEELSRRGNDMKVVFISYADTVWAPLKEKIKNPKRFALLFAPIRRSYALTLPEELYEPEIRPFELNKCVFPKNLYEYLAYLKTWDNAYTGDRISFEYNFWRHQTYDFTGLETAKRVYEDARAYEANGISGIIQCGGPCAYFPTGISYYTYAMAMYNKSLSFDEIVEEYFQGIFGDDWREIYEIFTEMSELLPADYVSSSSALIRPNVYVSEEMAEKIPKITPLLEREKKFVEAHYNSDRRVRTLAVRLLEKHIEFVTLMSEVFLAKAKGENEKALELFAPARIKFGRHEPTISKYFSHALYFSALGLCAKIKLEDVTYYLD